ncbi:urate oxidase [Streptomyces amakusaensis]|uniref:Uricase n=1 Tax=Streptomyces amakusaensis TaxID=67271 RepID=A0ABW0ALA1_9ACTN
MSTILGENSYGKSENRVVRIVREGPTHHIKDLTVSIALSGDMDEVHYSGSNAGVLPTDTAKNTVYAFAKEHGIDSAEQFGMRLARHFVTSQPVLRRARVQIEEHAWERVGTTGPTRHSFVRSGRETRVCRIGYDGADWEIVSGLQDLSALNSTDSEFRGYVKDAYTTLEETSDRILATEISARWRYRWSRDGEPAPDWDRAYERARTNILGAFAGTYSRSLQQTLYAMGSHVIERSGGEVDEIRLSLPNKHHFLVDLTPFGLTNDHEVYLAADRPYGLIEATVLRAGAPARIPADLLRPR